MAKAIVLGIDRFEFDDDTGKQVMVSDYVLLGSDVSKGLKTKSLRSTITVEQADVDAADTLAALEVKCKSDIIARSAKDGVTVARGDIQTAKG